MDDTTQESGTGLWGTEHHVRRAAAGIGQSCLIFHRRMIRLFLSCNNSYYYIYKTRAEKPSKEFFSPVITIEDQHLQTFLHTLICKHHMPVFITHSTSKWLWLSFIFIFVKYVNPKILAERKYATSASNPLKDVVYNQPDWLRSFW